MDQELEEKLVKKYPNLYQRYGGDMTKTCMHWGFAHSNGWYKLIDELSAHLEPLGIIAEQVKQKFGGLRFYVDYPKHLTDEQRNKVRKIKNEYEQKSYEICEVCGEPGKTGGRGYIRTLCDKCNKTKYDDLD